MRSLDPVRTAQFLAELKRGGNVHKAAALASPGCGGTEPGYTTFCARRRRDVQFRAAWDAALAEHQAGERRKRRLVLVLAEAAA